ncbi:hypothetical protein IQ235_17805 [Oscillatoriales cyanobacterium LEGE 11467]|uniref:Uncharacterized protein n=1 Tax=Zarconia navalis LEGE 11467 TaxID=1828826 RepID=A0A928VYH2_9CYAN|nr:hypothetical protein [Zarconia navalis LEGE 11467]
MNIFNISFISQFLGNNSPLTEGLGVGSISNNFNLNTYNRLDELTAVFVSYKP